MGEDGGGLKRRKAPEPDTKHYTQNAWQRKEGDKSESSGTLQYCIFIRGAGRGWKMGPTSVSRAKPQAGSKRRHIRPVYGEIIRVQLIDVGKGFASQCIGAKAHCRPQTAHAFSPVLSIFSFVKLVDLLILSVGRILRFFDQFWVRSCTCGLDMIGGFTCTNTYPITGKC